MKKVSSILFLLFCNLLAFPQSCLPDGIEFTTQAQIDSFQVHHPGCSEIEGSVFIIGDEIFSLSGLSLVESIGGDLRIGNTALLDLEGLNSLTHISGALQIHGNAVLKKTDGLDSLEWIGEGLAIKHNTVLDALTSLSSLQAIDGLYIEHNDNLTSLNGLQSISSTVIDIQIIGNEELSNLSALSGLTGISRYLEVIENPSLESLEGLENLEIDAYLISITDNFNLCHCAVESICDYLHTPQPGWYTITIRTNKTGCNSVEEVQDLCDVSVNSDTHFFKDKIILYPNPAKQELNISVERYLIDEVSIYTLTGQLVLQERPENGTIDISHLQPGIYIVGVMVEGRKVRKKLVVE